MRPTVVIATLLVVAVVCGLAFFTTRTTGRSPAVTSAPVPAAVEPASHPAPSAEPPSPAPLASAALVVTNQAAPFAPVVGAETNHAEYVQNRVAELMKLAMNDDTDSLNTIWSEMSNPDKEIRAGALAALVQFGDASIAPRLRELAATTDDPREKVNILDAADQLELPPLGSGSTKGATNE